MILYGNKETDRAQIAQNEYDICIVGAGAVGFTMAYALSKSGKKVIVLESGVKNDIIQKSDCGSRREYDQLVQKLDNGEFAADSFGPQTRPGFFIDARTRCLGGSTNCWGGWIRPLDSWDFKEWPVNIETKLARFYGTALEIVGLDRNSFQGFNDPLYWKGKTALPVDVFDKAKMNAKDLDTVVIQQQTDVGKIDFQDRFPDLFTSEDENENKNMVLVRNATATYLHTNYAAGKPGFTSKGLTCRFVNPNGTPCDKKDEFKVTAKKYVLAMGGLEIPRFLLNSIPGSYGLTELQSKGLGRYYMGHPKYVTLDRTRVGEDHLPGNKDSRRFYAGTVSQRDRPSAKVQAYIVPTETRLKKGDINNFRTVLSVDDSRFVANVEINFEQEPNRNSLIDLHPTKKDIFDNKLLLLDWRFTKKDQATVNQARTMMRSYMGYFGNFNWDPPPFVWNWNDKDPKTQYPPFVGVNEPYTGDHHMGVCRMGKNDEGVVDENCKVTGFDNMWICSTAVYPTGGWANATFTLLALALYLADHLTGTAIESDLQTAAATAG